MDLFIDKLFPYPFSFEEIKTNNDNVLLLNDGIFPLRKGKGTIVYKEKGITTSIDYSVIANRIKKKEYESLDIEGIALNKDFVLGVDISSVFFCHDNEAFYYNEEGIEESLFSLVKRGGSNTIRARLWLDPTFEGIKLGGGDNDLGKALLIGEITKKLGLSFLLDIHYSDFWADPAKQSIPKCFLKYDKPELIAKALYDYTSEVLRSFAENRIAIDYVQIGNEITNGLLTHVMTKEFYVNEAYLPLDKRLSGTYNTENFYLYLKSCIKALKDFSQNIKSIIHIDRGADYEYSHEFYTNLVNNGIDFDCIGLSYYPYFHGTIDKLIENITKLDKEFDKEIYVAETSYPYTTVEIEESETVFNKNAENEYEASPNGQAQLLRNISKALSSIRHGKGLFYWEPAWLGRKNNGWAKGMPCSWSDQAFFDNDGHALPSLFSYKKIKKEK